MNKPDIPFVPWPKLSRFRREVVISEKIDGTNAGILIQSVNTEGQKWEGASAVGDLMIHASSRKRWITPGKEDNSGFALWVEENKETLIEDLGPGMHFGEWWGKGIQRNYGLDHKRFSLFNTSLWAAKNGYFKTPDVASVPVIAQGLLSDDLIDIAEQTLMTGSFAAPGYDKPEGLVIFHIAANKSFKFTFGDDGNKDYRKAMRCSGQTPPPDKDWR
jgi:hypothetical protein